MYSTEIQVCAIILRGKDQLLINSGHWKYQPCATGHAESIGMDTGEYRRVWWQQEIRDNLGTFMCDWYAKHG